MTNLPVSGKFTVTAVFGQTGKYWATRHKGVDIVAADRTVYGTCDGTVRVVANDKSGWGNYVSVGDGQGRRHIFCHLKSIAVKPGDRVSRSTVIGVMGDTGNATGVHLHYQINDKNNEPVDPTGWLGIPNKRGAYDPSVSFKDEKSVADWAKAAVAAAARAGIMKGDENGHFRPKGVLTREEAAVIISRLLERWG